MKTLPHWGNLLPLLGATLAYYLGLGWLGADRATAHLAECGHPPRRAYAAIPTDDEPDWWCPAHESWFPAEVECPGCRDEWEEAMAERYDAEHQDDGWYLDLTRQAEYPGFNPHDERGDI
jgi:hypothetical protein